MNTGHSEFYPTVVADGSLYFVSDRPSELGPRNLHRAARRADGGFEPAVPVGPPIDTEHRKGDTFVAPDESYLIFASERPGGFGGADLYLSVHKPDGSWGEPRNLGPAINTAESEYTPMLSPDGKYLFFTRGRQGYDGLYWVDAEVLR